MKIHISKEELQSHGCINCIWKTHNQCPHDIKDEETYPQIKDDSKSIKGMCPEYLNFIFSFAGDEDSVNALWEKFSLYIARLQSLDDYKEYLAMRDEIKALRESEKLDPKQEMQYDAKLNILRLWWERLNDSVRKGYGRIADRESKEKEGGKIAGILSAKTINFNIGQDKKEEIEYDKDKKKSTESNKVEVKKS